LLIAFDISGYQITYDQPLAKGNQGSGSQSRAITLRTTPSPCVGTLVHVEFGLTQTTGGKRARGVGDCLDIRLGADILFDHGEEGGVTVLELINQDLHGQGRVTSPSIVVYPDELLYTCCSTCGLPTVRAAGAGTGNDNAWLRTGSIRTTRTNVIEDTLSCNRRLRGQPGIQATSRAREQLWCCDGRVAEAQRT
jgi:hypothetical protein